MTSRFVMFACFVTCVGCGPAVEDDPTAEAGTTSTGDGSTATTSEDTTSSVEDTGEASTTSSTTTAPDPSTSSAESSTSGGEESTSSSGEPFEADCEVLCDDLVDGSCVGLVESCALTCQAAVGAQGDAVAAAFEACVSTQRLCFSFLEDCMWSELYGEEAVEQRYDLEGSGFDAWEGRTVYSALLVGGERVPGSSASIESGLFTVDAIVTAPFDVLSNSRTFYVFVDVDDDGVCTAADHAQSVWMENLGTDFSEPVFVLETTPEAESNVWICGQF